MGKTWVLDTETKGTGAEVVPLEKVQRRHAPVPLRTAPRRPKPAPAARNAPPQRPPSFKVVDVMTREVLAEGADARATVELLEGVRSVVDVVVHARDPNPESDAWRKLSLAEQKRLWAFRRTS